MILAFLLYGLYHQYSNQTIISSDFINCSEIHWCCYNNQFCTFDEELRYINSINSTSKLIDLIYCVDDSDIMLLILDKIDNQKIFKQLIHYDYSDKIVANSMKMIDNETIIKMYLTGNYSIHINKIALYTINDIDFIKNHVFVEQKRYMRNLIIEDFIDNQTVLKQLSLTDNYDGNRLSAIDKINDINFLTKYLEFADDYFLRMHLNRRIQCLQQLELLNSI